jgi:predicted protein tyrosine phosphatase
VHIEKDRRANNIILGQAARHVIVHAGARVTERMMRQVSKATPRTLKQELKPDAALTFLKEEVLELKGEMIAFVQDLAEKLEAQRKDETSMHRLNNNQPEPNPEKSSE